MPSDIAIVYMLPRIEQRVLEVRIFHKNHKRVQSGLTMDAFGVIITVRRPIRNPIGDITHCRPIVAPIMGVQMLQCLFSLAIRVCPFPR